MLSTRPARLLATALVAASVGALPSGAAARKPEAWKPVPSASFGQVTAATHDGTVFLLAQTRTAGTALLRIDPATGNPGVVGSLCAASRTDCRVDEFRLESATGGLVIARLGRQPAVWTTNGTTAPRRVLQRELRTVRELGGVRVGGATAIFIVESRQGTFQAVAGPASGDGWQEVRPAAAAVKAVTPSGGAYLTTQPESGTTEAELLFLPAGASVAERVAEVRSFDAVHVADERAFFTGRDQQHGLEPWTSDGTPSGTRMVADLTPGPDSSSLSTGVTISGRWVTAVSPNTGGVGRVHVVSADAAVPVSPTAGHGTAPPRDVVGRIAGKPLLVGGALLSAPLIYEADVDGGAAGATFQNAPANPEVLATERGAFLSAELPWPDRAMSGLWHMAAGGPAGALEPFRAAQSVVSGRNDYSSPFRMLGTIGEQLVFAERGELWMTDGTSAGTRRITQPGQFSTVTPQVTAQVDVRESARRWRLRITGEVSSEDLPASQVCRGLVKAQVSRGASGRATVRAALRPSDGRCTYSLRTSVPRPGQKNGAGRARPRLAVRVQTTGAGAVSSAFSPVVRIAD